MVYEKSFEPLEHGVWKSKEKSHSTLLGAKQVKLTFLADKSSLKMTKMVNFGEF